MQQGVRARRRRARGREGGPRPQRYGPNQQVRARHGSPPAAQQLTQNLAHSMPQPHLLKAILAQG